MRSRSFFCFTLSILSMVTAFWLVGTPASAAITTFVVLEESLAETLASVSVGPTANNLTPATMIAPGTFDLGLVAVQGLALGSPVTVVTADPDSFRLDINPGDQHTFLSNFVSDPFELGGLAETFSVNRAGANPGDIVTFTVNSPAEVPEPSVLLLVGAGLGLSGIIFRFRRHKTVS